MFQIIQQYDGDSPRIYTTNKSREDALYILNSIKKQIIENQGNILEESAQSFYAQTNNKLKGFSIYLEEIKQNSNLDKFKLLARI